MNGALADLVRGISAAVVEDGDTVHVCTEHDSFTLIGGEVPCVRVNDVSVPVDGDLFRSLASAWLATEWLPLVSAYGITTQYPSVGDDGRASVYTYTSQSGIIRLDSDAVHQSVTMTPCPSPDGFAPANLRDATARVSYLDHLCPGDTLSLRFSRAAVNAWTRAMEALS